MSPSTGQSVRQYRIIAALVAIAGLVFVGTMLQLGSSPQLRLLASGFGTTKDFTSDRRFYEIEGLSLGEPFTDDVLLGTEDGHIESLREALRSRFAATLARAEKSPAYPNCTLRPQRYTRAMLHSQETVTSWQKTRRTAIVSIAVNLHNSEGIIPSQALALLEAVYLLLRRNRVFVSIYENGSSDSTRRLLADFASALQAIGVDGLWLHTSRMLSDFRVTDRIVMLSEIRNLALAPMIPYATDDTGAGTFLFMNDVMTCSSDILELIHQQRLQKADMVMGTDWGTINRTIRQDEPGYLSPEDSTYDPKRPPYKQVPRLYDMWVTRGISGDLVYPFRTPGGYTPISDSEDWVTDAFSTESKGVRERWLEGRPFPVYSGWGGMAAFDASLFTSQHLRFRSSTTSGWSGGSSTGALGPWGRLVSSEGYLASDCPGASECEYIARDIWNLRDGKARIVLAPQARTAYNIDDWLVITEAVPPPRHVESDSDDDDLIDWSGVNVPDTVVCIASRDKDGTSLDAWSEDNHRVRLDPVWRPGNNSVAKIDDHESHK